MGKNKKINECREYDAARAAMALAEKGRMKAKQMTLMTSAKQATQMAYGE